MVEANESTENQARCRGLEGAVLATCVSSLNPQRLPHLSTVVKRPNPEQSRVKPKSGGHELTHPLGTQYSHVAARNQDRPVLCVMRTPHCSQPASRYLVPLNAGSSLLSLTVVCPLVFLFKWHVFDECCISLTKKIIERKRTDCSVLISKHANKLSSLTEPTQCYTGNSYLYLIPLKLTQKSMFH